MKTYFDGSEGCDDTNAKWLTLAGYGATDSFWARFDDKWKRLLLERYPIAPYIHMWEIISGTDPFERRSGWTKEKISDLIVDTVKLLQGFDKTIFRQFVCSIDLSAHQRLVGEGYKIDDPFSICSDVCVGSAIDWFLKKKKPEPLYLCFDRGEKFMSGIKKKWLANRTPPGRVSVDPSKLLWDSILDIQELDMETTPPLQAADMVAWARTRSLSEETRDWKYLAHIM